MVNYNPSENPASLSLCRPCNAIFEPNSYVCWAEEREKKRYDEPKPHHVSETSLRDAVEQNCWLCRRLLEDRGPATRFESFEEGSTYNLSKVVDPRTSMHYVVCTEGSRKPLQQSLF
jgi:hypothetical protein